MKKLQGHTLIDLIQREKAKTIAEVGIHKGRTIKRVLRVVHGKIGEYWAIDPWCYLGTEYGGKMGNAPQEDWDNIYFSVSKLTSFFPKLHIIRATSERAAKSMFLNEFFDLVFIDADHRYEAVKKDIELWYPKVKINGLLTGHDYGARKTFGVKQAVDEAFGKPDEVYPETYVWVKRKKNETILS